MPTPLRRARRDGKDQTMTQTRDETLPVGGGVNRAQQDYWETDGPRQYRQFGDTNEALLAPAGQAMLDAAQLRPGERVLDVGCGFGTSTLEAAERVAPSGRVVGVDISAAMLQPARERIAAAGADNVELLHADAQAYAFETGSFDAVISRFGMMFFEDPQAAFTNLARALRSGGRLVSCAHRIRSRTHGSWSHSVRPSRRWAAPPISALRVLRARSHSPTVID
jgi:SAM-dependent methyltransferase